MMNVVDSSAWLEYFAATKNAKHFKDVIEDTKNLIVPTITIFEVFKKILQRENAGTALETITYMKHGTIADLSVSISLDAVKLSMKFNIPMADSIILATAQYHNATLWTQDIDFKKIPGVKFFRKTKNPQKLHRGSPN